MHYYPFGGIMGESSEGNAQPFRYNGKEYETMGGLNMHDYGARFYDQTLGRWHVMDEKAEDYYNVSPYAYCMNDPVNAIDPDGKKVKILTSGQDRMYVLDQMQKLTNDKLGLLRNGEVVILKTGTANCGRKFLTGTKLISSLIENKHWTMIEKNYDFRTRAKYPADGTNGVGSDTRVFLIPKRDITC